MFGGSHRTGISHVFIKVDPKGIVLPSGARFVNERWYIGFFGRGCPRENLHSLFLYPLTRGLDLKSRTAGK
jgi:hypothetical protein